MSLFLLEVFLDINWFPGHMTKEKRQLAEQLKVIDLVIEVADARAPKSTLNPDFDQMFAGKKRLLILNKSDLADESLTRAWEEFYQNQNREVLVFSCVKSRPDILLKKIDEASRELVEKYRQKGVNKTVRAMAAGIPNVGKSALLNRRAGQKRAKEGNRPGVTKGLQWVKVGKYLELMDTPGILWPKIEEEHAAVVIAVLKSIREEILDQEELALKFLELLTVVKPSAIQQRYGIVLEETPLLTMEAICKKRGFVVRGGEYDYERCAQTLLDEFQSGKLGHITLEKP